MDQFTSVPIQQDVYDRLARLARQRGVNAADIANELLKRHTVFEAEDLDRRKHPRRQDSIRAVVQTSDNDRAPQYRPVHICDLSIGGASASVAPDLRQEFSLMENKRLEMFFTLPETTTPLRFVCRLCHVLVGANRINLGLAFEQGDAGGYELLASRLSKGQLVEVG